MMGDTFNLKSDWVTWGDLAGRITELGILTRMQAGLQPYDRSGDPIFCPIRFHEHQRLRDLRLPDTEFFERGEPIMKADPKLWETGDDPKGSWRFLVIPRPADSPKFRELISLLCDSQFNLSDLDEGNSASAIVEKKRPLDVRAQRRYRAQEVAKRLKASHPEMTIAAIVKHPDFEACYDGDPPSEKTRREHLSGLFPDAKRGRPKKKK